MQGTNRESLGKGSGFKVQGSGFRVQGSGLWWRLRRRIKGAMPEGRGDSHPFVSSSRASRGIFVIRGKAINVSPPSGKPAVKKSSGIDLFILRGASISLCATPSPPYPLTPWNP